MSKRKKLFELEKNVLPKSPKPAKMCIENIAEIELNKRANQIRQKISVDLLDVWHNDELTLEEKQNITLKVYNELDEQEKQIVSKDTQFTTRRLQDILFSYYKKLFPKNSVEPILRVLWFFNEMEKLALAKHMEESELNHNRNEDDPDFDDIYWWKTFDLKINREFPDGIFTKQSYNKIEKLYDKILLKLMHEKFKKENEQ